MARAKISKETYQKALKIAVPAIIESFFIQLVALIDSFMVSTLDPYAVAAVGLTVQPKFIGLAIFMAISVATSAIVARRFGEKRKKDANETLATTLAFVLILAVIFSIVYVVFADDIIRFCGSTSTTHEYASTYLKIVMGGMVFNCLQIAINSAQRGAGNTKITMTTNVTSNLVNVVFNYLLIGGNLGFPKLGIAGAAIATVLGTVVSSIMSICSLLNKERFISLIYIIKEKIRPTINAFKTIIKVGYSVFLEQLFLRIGFAATALMAADMGDNAMAAHQVVLNFMAINFAFGDGLQSAAVALIGKSLGEKEPDKARAYGNVCQVLGLGISLVLAVVYLFISKLVMDAFFPSNQDIANLGAMLLKFQIIIVLFQISNVIFMGSLRGAGDTLYTAIVSSVSVTFVRTIVSYLCAYTLSLGIFGVWLGVLADAILKFVLASIRFKRGKWVKIKV